MQIDATERMCLRNRMKIYRVALVLLSLPLTAVSVRADPDGVQAERKALTGKWICQSSEVDGFKRGAKESKEQTISFAGEKCIQEDAETGDELLGTYELDLTGTQKTLAMKLMVGSREVKIRYIFERNGDTLKLCAHLLPGGELPMAFSAPAGSKCVYLVLKRSKE